MPPLIFYVAQATIFT